MLLLLPFSTHQFDVQPERFAGRYACMAFLRRVSRKRARTLNDMNIKSGMMEVGWKLL
jgi:hypothetical protein